MTGLRLKDDAESTQPHLGQNAESVLAHEPKHSIRHSHRRLFDRQCRSKPNLARQPRHDPICETNIANSLNTTHLNPQATASVEACMITDKKE